MIDQPASSTAAITRREFVAGTACLVAAPAIAQTDEQRRVAILGHTGRGNYGHGLDVVWKNFREAQIVGVADADEKGLAKALKKLGVDCGFTDYRAMLSTVKPEFVTVCPRHPDQHFDMVMAAIEHGVRGIYCEKPFVRTPAEADGLVEASTRANTKVAIAHRNRYHPALVHAKAAIAEGRIGKVLEIRGRGKDDHRGGDEDLWVLGCHTSNLIQYFAGPAVSCAARFLREKRPVISSDLYEGREALGTLAADEVHVRWETESGIPAFYDSIAHGETRGDALGLLVIGSQGMIAVHIDRNPVAHLFTGSPFRPSRMKPKWIPITSGGIGVADENPIVAREVNNHTVAIRDLIDAVDADRAPMCDIHQGAMTVEMISAAFASHRDNGSVVQIPLANRNHPWDGFATDK